MSRMNAEEGELVDVASEHDAQLSLNLANHALIRLGEHIATLQHRPTELLADLRYELRTECRLGLLPSCLILRRRLPDRHARPVADDVLPNQL